MKSLLLSTTLRRTLLSSRPLSTKAAASPPSWLSSVERIAETTSLPNEYPGQNYMFNWCLNADGVTPLKKSAYRITKPLDLKVAGLTLPKVTPLKVNAKSERSKVPEAGSDALDFDVFDTISQSVKDSLSLSDTLYCPEGHVPDKRVGVRIISNSENVAIDAVAYLERAPGSGRDPKPQSITCYVLEDGGAVEEFAGYAIEEVEEKQEDGSRVAVSVGSVVVSGKKVGLKRVVAGIELCVEGLEADARERSEKEEEEQAQA